jgi:hypothetical protein
MSSKYACAAFHRVLFVFCVADAPSAVLRYELIQTAKNESKATRRTGQDQQHRRIRTARKTVAKTAAVGDATAAAGGEHAALSRRQIHSEIDPIFHQVRFDGGCDCNVAIGSSSAAASACMVLFCFFCWQQQLSH